ncbi:MAG: hypothetical protein R6X18_11455 [Chloroflexota bacterium]|jgi:predicted RNA-binding Zn-ribbon protein involved in translation (DUF1610 family)
MKTAVSSNGVEMAASKVAPEGAYCPKCGGAVILRVRRLMANSGNSYYWRHVDSDHPCERHKPFLHTRLAT